MLFQNIDILVEFETLKFSKKIKSYDASEEFGCG